MILDIFRKRIGVGRGHNLELRQSEIISTERQFPTMLTWFLRFILLRNQLASNSSACGWLSMLLSIREVDMLLTDLHEFIRPNEQHSPILGLFGGSSVVCDEIQCLFSA